MTHSNDVYNRAYRKRMIALRPGESTASNFRGLGWLSLRSHSEVAAILRVSRQAVQQIERRALTKIRNAMREFYAEELQ